MSKAKTGFPSVDKPWMDFYDISNEQRTVSKISMYQYIFNNNKNNLNDIAIEYLNVKISYDKMFKMIDKTANSLS